MKPQRADSEYEGRIQVQDQALEIGADVLQAVEVEEARQVIAAETQAGQQSEVGSAQSRPVARRPPNSGTARARTFSDRIRHGRSAAALIHRSTRKLTLTAAGRTFFDRCAGAVSELAQAGQASVDETQLASGIVRVAAPADSSTSSRFRANTARAVLRAAVAGPGIALLPIPVIATDIAAGRLLRVLPEFRRDGADFYAVCVSRRHIPRALSAFIEFAVDRLRVTMSVA